MGVPLSDLEEKISALPRPERRLRLLEMILVLTVAFGGSLLFSVYLAISGTNIDSDTFVGGPVRTLYGILGQITSLALLVYVLYRRGSSLFEIGLSFSWKDIPRSLALAFIAGAVSWIWEYLVYRGAALVGGHFPSGGPRNTGFLLASPNVWSTFFLLLYVLINPIKEELIVRAFLISEVRWLSGRAPVAVLVSVIIQCSYHLYQGVYYALSYIALFLVFSLYYVRTGRIMPVILAHLYFDLGAVLR